MRRFEISFGIIKIPLDFVMTVLGFLVAYKLRLITEPVEGLFKPIDYTVLPTLREYLIFSLYAAGALLVVFTVGKMYSLKRHYSYGKELRKSLLLIFIWVALIITYFFFSRTFPFSRLAIIYSWVFTYIFVISGRTIIRIVQIALLKMGIGKRKLIFIGTNTVASEVFDLLKKNPHFKILGTIGKENSECKLSFLGNINQLEYLIKKLKPNEIIQTESNFTETQNEDILELCDLKNINYRFVPDLIDVRRTNIAVEILGSIPLISLKPTPLDGWGKVMKRATDIVGSAILLVVLSPVFLATAIAIKLDSKGPVFFTKLDDGSPVKRVGKHGKLFKFYKFRSMHPKTDRLRYTKLAEQNIRKDGPLMKIKNDPRITSVGKFIRKYSIDELPQLLSVLKGDLSLVGPRPHLPEEVSKYHNKARFVLAINPGITGLAQISGRSDLDFEKEIKLDRYYIENWSILMDIKIILKTLIVVLQGYEE
ncbi:MAG: sugar transferase [Candidatus Gracilibacteria bacterium]|jgi:exopolysaccharide biosynthesis polyprenyl glycosylphosphotransferase